MSYAHATTSVQAAASDAESAIARILACHYGDGAVYLPRELAARETLRRAIADGFMSNDGFITRKGRRLLARTEF